MFDAAYKIDAVKLIDGVVDYHIERSPETKLPAVDALLPNTENAKTAEAEFKFVNCFKVDIS